MDFSMPYFIQVMREYLFKVGWLSGHGYVMLSGLNQAWWFYSTRPRMLFIRASNRISVVANEHNPGLLSVGVG
jgi:hypothetical protein